MAIATICVFGVITTILLFAVGSLTRSLDQHDDCESF